MKNKKVTDQQTDQSMDAQTEGLTDEAWQSTKNMILQEKNDLKSLTNLGVIKNGGFLKPILTILI